LGDIVDAEAVYVKASLFTYADAGYMGTGGFSERNSTRAGRVYVAANDGMLHAFDATTGAEVWAYVPALVLPNLYTLADKDYANRHTYFLDGTPISGEICPTAPATPCTGSTWKTILVGGLNRGGRGYYALDVTDPAAPKALWEFTDTNMGFTFGNPEIAKLKDGTWVVMLTSGYNNMASTSWAGAGDGGGYLYVLNAATGALIGTPIPTNDASGVNVGSATTPSGLARIRAYVENAMVDNTALRTYGGDLLGNVWRFDINGDIGPAGKEAQRLVTLFSDTATAGTVPQPITARPELGDCNGNKIVLVGTGKFLGQTDIDVVPGKQSMYGIKDKLDATSFGNPQASASGFIQQTLTSTTCPAGTSSSVCTTGQSVRTATNNVVNLASDNGWYLNYPDSGERDNTDPTLGLATLAFNTNVPSDSSCVIGGFSFRYFVNFCTGAPIGAVGTGTGATSGVVSVRLGNALATRPVLVRLPSNAIVELTRLSDGTTVTSDVPIGPGVALTRRVSWRELTNDQ
jgi:type IV pilus assembly protein PilY1